MAFSRQSQEYLDTLNTAITALVQERDRARTLFNDTLPGDTTVWEVLPQAIRDTLVETSTGIFNMVKLELDRASEQIMAFRGKV